MARRTSGEMRDEYDETEEMEFTVSKDVEVLPTFEAMGLRDELIRGIFDYGKSGYLVC